MFPHARPSWAQNELSPSMVPQAWSLFASLGLSVGGEFEFGSGDVPLEEMSWLWCESDEHGESELEVSCVDADFLPLWIGLTLGTCVFADPL